MNYIITINGTDNFVKSNDDLSIENAISCLHNAGIQVGYRTVEEAEYEYLKQNALNSTSHEDTDNYNLVGWPECQELMEEYWFHDEAFLLEETPVELISPAYAIPKHRL